MRPGDGPGCAGTSTSDSAHLPFTPDGCEPPDPDGILRWLTEIHRTVEEATRHESDCTVCGSPKDTEGHAETRRAQLEALEVRARVLLETWRRASDAVALNGTPGGKQHQSFRTTEEDDASARFALAGAVDFAVKDLLRNALFFSTDQRELGTRTTAWPCITDVSTGGAVTRLVETVRHALEHGAKKGGWRESVAGAFAWHDDDASSADKRSTATRLALEQFERKFVSQERSLLTHMARAVTSAGKTRAWIRAGLHKNDLHERVAAFASTENLVCGDEALGVMKRINSGFYTPNAWSNDEEATVRVTGALRGLAVLPFAEPGTDGTDLDVASGASEDDAVSRWVEKPTSTDAETETETVPPNIALIASGLIRHHERCCTDEWSRVAADRLRALALPKALADATQGGTREAPNSRGNYFTAVSFATMTGVSTGVRVIETGVVGVASGVVAISEGLRNNVLVDGLKSGVGVVTGNVGVATRTVAHAGRFTVDKIGVAFSRNETDDHDDLLRDMSQVLQEQEGAVERK